MADDTAGKPTLTMINDGGEVKPAYANYIQAWIQAGMMRLTYGEITAGTNVRFHTAVVLSVADAQIFANLMLKLIADNPDKLTTPPLNPATPPQTQAM
jgi:hypothetical protein